MVNAPANEHETAELLKTSEVARLIGCSAQLIRLLADRGELPHTRILGMRAFRRPDVQELLDAADGRRAVTLAWSDPARRALERENALLAESIFGRREREAREEAARQEQAVRDGLYARAKAAADQWVRTDGGLTSAFDAERFQRHCVDLALNEPAIRIEWLQRNTRSEALVRDNGNALAFSIRRAIVCPPILDQRGYAVALHEQGHLRANTAGMNEIQREISAWRWARAHALVWDHACQDVMVASLGTYLHDLRVQDVFSLREAEVFMSDVEFKAETLRRMR